MKLSPGTTAQLKALGFRPLVSSTTGKRSLQLSTEGLPGSGKTDWILRTAPGPMVYVDIDFATSDIEEKVSTELGRDDIMVLPLLPEGMDPKEMSKSRAACGEIWNKTVNAMKLVESKEIRTIAIDGGSDLWTYLRMASFGELKGIIQLKYEEVNAMMLSLLRTPQKHGVHFIMTHKLEQVWVEEEYKDKQETTKKRRIWNGEYSRDGFRHAEHVFRTGIRHLARPRKAPDGTTLSGMEWGIKVLRSMANPDLIGDEYWGDEMPTFPQLGQYLYPNSTEDDWL